MKIMVVAFQVWFMGLDLWVIRKIRMKVRVRRGFLVFGWVWGRERMWDKDLRMRLKEFGELRLLEKRFCLRIMMRLLGKEKEEEE